MRRVMAMLRSPAILAGFVTAALATVLVTTGVIAANPEAEKGDRGPAFGDTRPGWGYGDDKHDHSGPPGKKDKEKDDKDKNKDKDKGHGGDDDDNGPGGDDGQEGDDQDNGGGRSRGRGKE